MERKEGLMGRGKVFTDIGEHTVKMALAAFLKASGKAVSKRGKSRGEGGGRMGMRGRP